MKFSRVAVIAIFLPLSAFCQEFRSTLSGTVLDATGSRISGAKVVATETRTGSKTQTVSDSSGQYTLPFLSPGHYKLSGLAQGFKEYIQKDIDLGSGDHSVIDLHLSVGDTTQSVEVSADAPLINTDNASVGQAITAKEVEDIPLNGGPTISASRCRHRQNPAPRTTLPAHGPSKLQTSILRKLAPPSRASCCE